MDDLISRQAAIDAVEESRRLNRHQDGKAACAHEYEHRHFLKILRELPFAQTIIHCEACKWFQRNMRPDGYLPKGVDEFECRHWCGPCDPVDFCSRAERREDND